MVIERLVRELKKDKNRNIGQKELNRLKLRFAREHHTIRVPTNIELATSVSEKDYRGLKNILSMKPTRNLSGVGVIAIMTKPANCRHGRCIYCPGGVKSFFGNVPQSYTGREPAAMRAGRNDYDSYRQVMNRLEQYVAMNRLSDKISL